MKNDLSAFRLGDIRGLYPDEVNESFAVDFAHAFVDHFGVTGPIATGRDMRVSSSVLQDALNQGLRESGIDVVDLGLCPTELGYFASTRDGIDAAIIVTASHNPARHNGFKCVLKDGRAVTFDTGLSEVMELMRTGFHHRCALGKLQVLDLRPEYTDFFRSKFANSPLKAEHIALNGLNGTASTLAEILVSEFELPVTWFRKEPGPIPSEGADPVNPRLAAQMKTYMESGDFGVGVAWDGDGDRCVFFDGNGDLVPTYYIVGLLAERFLQVHQGGVIVFDTKLCWNTLDVIREYGGVPVPSETGHAFMKRKMHEHQAVYGGELSSHHYFKDFFGCDSGMFAWLKVVELINQSGANITELVSERREKVCCTPEISLSLEDTDSAFTEIFNHYKTNALKVDYFDGLGFEMPGDWRFSLRRSKTEPLVRLNLESRGRPDDLLSEGFRLLQMFEPYRTDAKSCSECLRIQ
jgi:phosphomannomutase